jgi:hypothetical protein
MESNNASDRYESQQKQVNCFTCMDSKQIDGGCMHDPIKIPCPVCGPKEYTIVYSVPVLIGSHTVYKVEYNRVKTNDLKALLSSEQYDGNVHFVFEGHPKLEGE